MSYNMSFLGTSNTLYDMFTGVNTAVGQGILPIIFLAGLYLVLIASFRSYDTDRTFIIAGFITSIVASLFFFLGIIAWWVVMIFVISLIVSIIIHFFT